MLGFGLRLNVLNSKTKVYNICQTAKKRQKENKTMIFSRNNSNKLLQSLHFPRQTGPRLWGAVGDSDKAKTNKNDLELKIMITTFPLSPTNTVSSNHNFQFPNLILLNHNLSYSSSATGSSHSFEVSSPSTSNARWANHESLAAPCQCFTLAGMWMTVPGNICCAGLPSS